MLKTGKAKYDIFRTYYWHNAELVGNYKMPQLEATQAIPFNVISFNERTGIAHPEEHWVDFFIDEPLFKPFWNRPEKICWHYRYGLFYVSRITSCAAHLELYA